MGLKGGRAARTRRGRGTEFPSLFPGAARRHLAPWPTAEDATWHCRRRGRGGTMPNVQEQAAAFSVPLMSFAFSPGRGTTERRRGPATISGGAAPRGGSGVSSGGESSGAQASTGARARMANMSHLPPLPQIGHPESYYARLAKQSEREGDIHAHEAAKVGQYITLALDPSIDWDAKRRYFRHAIKRHCAPPQVSS